MLFGAKRSDQESWGGEGGREAFSAQKGFCLQVEFFEGMAKTHRTKTT